MNANGRNRRGSPPELLELGVGGEPFREVARTAVRRRTIELRRLVLGALAQRKDATVEVGLADLVRFRPDVRIIGGREHRGRREVARKRRTTGAGHVVMSSLATACSSRLVSPLRWPTMSTHSAW